MIFISFIYLVYLGLQLGTYLFKFFNKAIIDFNKVHHVLDLSRIRRHDALQSSSGFLLEYPEHPVLQLLDDLVRKPLQLLIPDQHLQLPLELPKSTCQRAAYNEALA